MKGQELNKALKEKYSDLQKELEIVVTFNQLDEAFLVSDAIQKEGFVSERFDRQLSYIVVDYLLNWNNYLHSIIMPNTQNMLNMSESKIFDADEKNKIMEYMKKIMEFATRNGIIGLKDDRKQVKKFLEDVFNFWNETFKASLIQLLEKTNMEWGKTQ